MLTLRFQTRTVSNPSSLNILTLSNWLTVKFHYSLIESTVKILNTLFLLAQVTLFCIVTSIISSRLTSLLYPLSPSHSLYPSKLIYESLTMAIPPKTKITNFKQIYPIYQMYNFNTSKSFVTVISSNVHVLRLFQLQ